MILVRSPAYQTLPQPAAMTPAILQGPQAAGVPASPTVPPTPGLPSPVTALPQGIPGGVAIAAAQQSSLPMVSMAAGLASYTSPASITNTTSAISVTPTVRPPVVRTPQLAAVSPSAAAIISAQVGVKVSCVSRSYQWWRL